MKAFGYAASRLLPLAAGAGFSAANLHNLAGVATGILTAIYTAFITIEAGLRVLEKWHARKAARGSPRTKADA